MPARSLLGSRGRLALLAFFVAAAAYANSLGNGLAYDDEGVIAQNPTTLAGDWRGAWGRPMANIVGGASMFASLLPSGGINMGERNVEATKRVLRLAEIPLVASDTGGDHGRSVYFHVSDGRVVVKSLKMGERVL